MLSSLFGNKNIEKVLLFLFVNHKGYGHQLQRLLNTPLTSLQNALNRLETGRIIMSAFEGKTKLYHLNPAYPLSTELEQLLKKSYMLLSPQEKKTYSLVQQEIFEGRFQKTSLTSFWQRLKTIKQFVRIARSRSKEERGWNGKGKGEVLITTDENVLVFHERGSWLLKDNNEINFSNTFRWTLDLSAGLISLEHLRLGPDQPVFLFHLTPTSTQLLASVDSHLCEEDVYLASVPWDSHNIRLNWRVIGPKKNEEMETYYT